MKNSEEVIETEQSLIMMDKEFKHYEKIINELDKEFDQLKEIEAIILKDEKDFLDKKEWMVEENKVTYDDFIKHLFNKYDLEHLNKNVYGNLIENNKRLCNIYFYLAHNRSLKAFENNPYKYYKHWKNFLEAKLKFQKEYPDVDSSDRVSHVKGYLHLTSQFPEFTYD